MGTRTAIRPGTRSKARPRRAPSTGRAKAAAASPFARLFASETLVSVLGLFLLNAERSYYQAQVAAITGARLYVVQRELARLEQAGLVIKEPSGNRVYYRANRRHPTFEDLKRAFLKTVFLGDSFRSALVPLADTVQVAFIYGSYARGEERQHSDIDLMVVGSVSGLELSQVLWDAQRELGREVNSTIYPREEFRDKARSGHYFIADVLRNPKLFLIGDEHELAAIAE